MAKRVVKEVHHTSGGGGGFGVLGVIIGALLVVGAIFFFAGGSDMFASRGGSSGPSVTVNTAPSGGQPRSLARSRQVLRRRLAPVRRAKL